MVELAVYAFVAAFIFFRLYGSLGRASGLGVRTSYSDQSDSSDAHAACYSKQKPEDVPLESVVEAENFEEISCMISAMKERCSELSIGHFIEGSAAAFEAVVEATNQKNVERLSSLLTTDLLRVFTEEIERRKASGLVHKDVIVSILSQKIVGASLVENCASITVKFITEQINIVENSSGEVVSGSASKMNVIEDTWKFERDITAPGRRWLLASVSN